MNMRGTPCIVMIFPWICARLDREEAVTSFGIGDRASAAAEIRVERRVVVIVLVRITPGRIGLPDFDQRIGHGLAVFIEHASCDDYALAERLAGMLMRQVVVSCLDVFMAEYRTGYFRQGLRQQDQR